MNIQQVDKILFENLPRCFLTLTTCSSYYVELDEDSILIRTDRRSFKIEVECIYKLLFDVLSLKSFEIKNFKYKHKHSAYLLPVIKYLIVLCDVNINEYAEPKGGWKIELTQELIIEEREKRLECFEMIEIYHKEYSDSYFNGMPESLQKKEALEKNVVVDVYYATNRQPSKDKGIFGNLVDNKTNYGVAKVSVPKNEHRSGSVERPSGFFKIIIREDKNKHFVIDSGENLKEADFFDALKSESNKKSLMVFVHGYNVSFQNAIFKSAQIKYDLNYEWPLVLFSWPSKSSVKSYVSDKESALNSSVALASLLKKISEMDIDEVFVIGHSMGTFCLAEALRELDIKDNPFQRLVLAAADIQKQAFFERYCEKIKASFNMVSLYASSSDKALIASNMINESERVGDTRNGIVVVDGIESIDMSELDDNLFSLGHSYISESNRALDDLYHFLINGLPAEMRRLKKLLNGESKTYWSLHY
ncbi:alpha/beta hydrolase [Vibrio sp. RM-69-4]|uniref:alpha/beta hydrolase n=1 Tax=Vibrio sp. RM-69-4 TaxID=2950157 RepID=UPI00215BB150|nr:alpha/beta hydrolase [Vibrio sp. RM-69-4]MCR9420668.1 alpha/beta hydrolase [Vibrio sp. RM-69-4]